MKRTLAIATFVLGGACAAPTAHAQDAPRRPLADALRVEPEGAPCLTHAALTTRVSRWLGTTEVDAALGIDVQADPAPEGVEASFTIRRDGKAHAERRFDVLPRECRARLAAVSLAIALAIDHTVLERISSDELAALSGDAEDTGAGATPDDVTSPSKARTQPDDAGELADREHEDEEDDDEPTSTGRRTYGPGAGPDLSLAVGGFAAVNVVPDLAPGARAELGLAIDSTWSLRLSGLFAAEVDDALGGGDVSASLIAGGAHTCAGTPVDGFHVGGCLGLVVGAYAARGVGFMTTGEVTKEWVGVGAAVEASFRLVGDLALRPRVELLAPLIKPSLEVVDPTGATLATLTAPVLGVLLGLDVLYPMP